MAAVSLSLRYELKIIGVGVVELVEPVVDVTTSQMLIMNVQRARLGFLLPTKLYFQ
jgi:short-subunit dehydrogenase involved in D-alanine esterification of teichoic acids